MPREAVFGFHQGETYGQYLDRLQDASLRDYTPESKAAALMTTVMLMQHGNKNKPIQRENFNMAKNALLKSPVFKKMVKDPEALEMIRGNNADGLFRKLNELTVERQQALDRKYKRPSTPEVVKQDNQLLTSAIDRLKNTAGTAPTEGSPELRRRGRYYTEMMKELEYARSLSEKGIQLNGEQTKKLISAVKAYNDAGKQHVKPGGEKQAEGFSESMTVLKNYMPAADFRSYCLQMNISRGVNSTDNPAYVAPEAFEPSRVIAGAKTAKELKAENRMRMQRAFGTDVAAEALAIRQLSQGNPNKLITEAELKRQTDKINQPGTAFMRAMQDPRTRKEFQDLAERGDSDMIADDLGKEMLEESRWRVVTAAQGEINRSIRRLTNGSINNRHFTEQYLANILAAEQLAVNAKGDEVINNGAFRERAEELQKDPAFQRLAQRYMENPRFRENMNRDLLKDRSALDLAKAYQQEKQPRQAMRNHELDHQPHAQENEQPEQQVQPAL